MLYQIWLHRGVKTAGTFISKLGASHSLFFIDMNGLASAYTGSLELCIYLKAAPGFTSREVSMGVGSVAQW